MAKRGLKRPGRLRRPAKQGKPSQLQASLPTQGRHHDLLTIYDTVNWQYFNGKIRAIITWGRKLNARRRHHKTIRMGFATIETRLIGIHRALDQAWIPRFFVEYVVFHEMLHFKYPPRRKNGHNNLHHEKFVTAEKKFSNYVKAERWEKINLNRLLFF